LKINRANYCKAFKNFLTLCGTTQLFPDAEKKEKDHQVQNRYFQVIGQADEIAEELLPCPQNHTYKAHQKEHPKLYRIFFERSS